jgi:hypothetical protein
MSTAPAAAPKVPKPKKIRAKVLSSKSLGINIELSKILAPENAADAAKLVAAADSKVIVAFVNAA